MFQTHLPTVKFNAWSIALLLHYRFLQLSLFVIHNLCPSRMTKIGSFNSISNHFLYKGFSLPPPLVIKWSIMGFIPRCVWNFLENSFCYCFKSFTASSWLQFGMTGNLFSCWAFKSRHFLHRLSTCNGDQCRFLFSCTFHPAEHVAFSQTCINKHGLLYIDL